MPCLAGAALLLSQRGCRANASRENDPTSVAVARGAPVNPPSQASENYTAVKRFSRHSDLEPAQGTPAELPRLVEVGVRVRVRV